MKDIDSYERSVAQADEALRLMVEQRCPPTPRNYAIWFTYAGGDNPTLVEAVDRAVAQAGTLTEDDASRIHDLFLAPRTDEQEMRELSVQLKGEMDGVLDMIEAARGRATDYGRELGNMSAELDGADDFSSVRAIVTTLVTATREMEQYNSELKQHLQVSRAQISELNRSLETALIESRTDPLTGITNRKGFHEKLDRLALESAQDGDGELCLLLGDIDHFKKFNDSYGHQTGEAGRFVHHHGGGRAWYRGALRRRGVRGAAAGYHPRAGRGHRQSDPQDADVEAADPEVHRPRARVHHDVMGGGTSPGRRGSRGPDLSRRRMPLHRQARRSEPRSF